MSETGIILKKKEDVDFDRLLHDIKLAADRADLEAWIDSNIHEDKYDGGVGTTGNIADTFENIPEAQQWRMDIYSNDRVFFEYGDIRKKDGLIRVVFIDNAPECDRILLDFLFEYFKLNPYDYFWLDGAKWHFTYEDIKKIKQQKYDSNWCNKDPHADDFRN